ncbi:uncharacterized protein UTRI_01237_B [Ustilago trichophora]|uniref:Uncharacterized protein n=1 Tax=Ustilago trichophora TaxID=86804 RepID=A0A5C3DVX0_9BASI|nr:uncharacterized protein UTRI_01237_B [Ustilago trichophora]
MMVPTSVLALTQLLTTVLNSFTSAPHALVSSSSSDASSSSSHTLSSLVASSPDLRVQWSGTLPPGNEDGIRAGASVSACTFAVGPPGPPAEALCPAFEAYCAAFRDEMRSRHIRTLKSTSPFSSGSRSISPSPSASSSSSQKANSKPPKPARTNAEKQDEDGDENDPLHNVKFRSGCVGGAGLASDGTYLSGYTATCIVDGVDWVPFVFDSFLRKEFAEQRDGGQDGPLPIYTSFVGCQVPAHL